VGSQSEIGRHRAVPGGTG